MYQLPAAGNHRFHPRFWLVSHTLGFSQFPPCRAQGDMLTDLLLLLLILFQRPQCECYTDQGLEGGILPGCATRQGVPLVPETLWTLPCSVLWRLHCRPVTGTGTPRVWRWLAEAYSGVGKPSKAVCLDSPWPRSRSIPSCWVWAGLGVLWPSIRQGESENFLDGKAEEIRASGQNQLQMRPKTKL